MNILIDFTQIPIQKVGVGVYARETFFELLRDTNNKYCCLVQDDDKDMLNTLKSSKIIFVKSKWFRFFFFRFFLEQFYIPWICYKYKINIVHSLHYSFPLIPLRAKKVVTIHDLTFFIYPKAHTIFKRYYFRFFIRFACRFADEIICVSNSTLNDLNLHIKPIKSKTQVIPLACEQPKVFDLESINNTKAKFGLHRKYLLFIGTLKPRKNIVNLLIAFEKIVKNDSCIDLVIVGKKGWFYNDTLTKVQELNIANRVIFTGFVTTEEKFIILSGAYAFIYPSIYEGFGLPVLESITYKIPTVTSNISSLPEVVGQAAILMNPNNIDSIYNALKEVLYNENTRLILVERCSKQAKKFSWEITAKMTENVYDKYQVVK